MTIIDPTSWHTHLERAQEEEHRVARRGGVEGLGVEDAVQDAAQLLHHRLCLFSCGRNHTKNSNESAPPCRHLALCVICVSPPLYHLPKRYLRQSVQARERAHHHPEREEQGREIGPFGGQLGVGAAAGTGSAGDNNSGGGRGGVEAGVGVAAGGAAAEVAGELEHDSEEAGLPRPIYIINIYVCLCVL